jgi:hypothetical protein
MRKGTWLNRSKLIIGEITMSSFFGGSWLVMELKEQFWIILWQMNFK